MRARAPSSEPSQVIETVALVSSAAPESVSTGPKATPETPKLQLAACAGVAAPCSSQRRRESQHAGIAQ